MKTSYLKLFTLLLTFLFFVSCGKEVFKSGDRARKISPDPRERVKKNLEEGKGFRVNDILQKTKGSGNFEFSSSNELWRASLDIIDFMPISTANYSGGIIVTDWYSENQKIGESVKITIRFLTNEIRADALDITVFYKKCKTALDCEIKQSEGQLKKELAKSILKRATMYNKENKEKNFKPYRGIIK